MDPTRLARRKLQSYRGHASLSNLPPKACLMKVPTRILLFAVLVLNHLARGENTLPALAINRFTSRIKPIDWKGLNTIDSLRVARITSGRGGHGNNEGSDPSTVTIHKLTGSTSRIDLNGLSTLLCFLGPCTASAHGEEQGNRRAQSTVCDSQRSALKNCLPSQECAGCFNNQFQPVIDQANGTIACAKLENVTCTIAPTCSCGCETEAEAFYACLVADATQGDCTIDCTNPQPNCDDELSAADSCLASANTVSCIECVENLFAEGEQTACTDLGSSYCTAIYDTCDCGICATEVESWYDCRYSQTVCGGLQCDQTPQTPASGLSVAPTPAPAELGSQPECDDEYTAASSCVSTVNPSCPQCVNESLAVLFEESEQVACSIFESSICTAIYDTCECGSCADQIENFFLCTFSDNGCTELQCNNSNGGGADETSICAEEQSALSTCLPSQECADCFENLIQQAADRASGGVTCFSIENELCAIAPDCNCGCDNEAGAYFRCILEDQSEGQCMIDCSNTQCDTELSAADDCLAFDPSCPQCVFESLDFMIAETEQISCSTFESKSCTAIYDRCGCGSCGDEFEAYFFCLTLEAGCGALECDDTAQVSSPTDSPATSPPIVTSPLPEKTLPPQTTPTPTVSDRSVPINDEVTNASQSSSDGTSFNNGYLAALVAIPLIIVILYLVKRNKMAMGPTSRSADSAKDVIETPPMTPVHTSPSDTQTRQAPDSPYHQTEPSITSSRVSEEEYDAPDSPHRHSELSVISSISSGGGCSLYET